MSHRLAGAGPAPRSRDLLAKRASPPARLQLSSADERPDERPPPSANASDFRSLIMVTRCGRWHVSERNDAGSSVFHVDDGFHVNGS